MGYLQHAELLQKPHLNPKVASYFCTRPFKGEESFLQPPVESGERAENKTGKRPPAGSMSRQGRQEGITSQSTCRMGGVDEGVGDKYKRGQGTEVLCRVVRGCVW